MPRNVNGIGTTYYGASDRQPDQSFVTTEWFILLSVPLIPLRSVRVRYLGESSQWGNTTKLYDVVGPAPLDTRQVGRVLAWLFGPAALLFLFSILGANSRAASSLAATLCGGGLIAGMIFWIIIFPSLYKAE